eukprot:1669477-Rhodomonas_salina.1
MSLRVSSYVYHPTRIILRVSSYAYQRMTLMRLPTLHITLRALSVSRVSACLGQYQPRVSALRFARICIRPLVPIPRICPAHCAYFFVLTA